MTTELCFSKPTRTDIQRSIKELPQLPQRQDSLNDQLLDLRSVAIRLGMYDADDMLRTILKA